MQLKNFNTYFFFIVLIAVSFFAFKMFAPYLSALFVAAIIAVLLRRFYTWLYTKTGKRAALSAAIACFLALFVVILPIVGVVSVVANEAITAVEKVMVDGSPEQTLALKVIGRVENMGIVQSFITSPQDILSDEDLRATLKDVGQGAVTILQKTSKGFVDSIIWIFVMFFSLFYFFIDGKRIMRRVMDLSPMQNKHEQILIDKFASMTRATLKGTVVIGLIQGSLGGLAILIAGIQSPMIWTVVMIILSIIPAIGAALVLIPMGIVLIISGSIWQGIFLLLAALFISSIDNVLRPKLVGNDTQMHTLLIFFATLGGLSVFGIIGFIVGPIIMALFIALWEIYALEFKSQLKEFN